MAIVINATRNVSYYAYGEMMTKLRNTKKSAEAEAPAALSAKKEEVEPAKLSSKVEEVKPVELSKKEEAQAPAMLAPAPEVENVALSPASEPVEAPAEEVTPEEGATEEAPVEEQTEGEEPEELKIVVKSDELLTEPNDILGSINADKEMDYNEDGEVTIDERMRYLEEQTKANSMPQAVVDDTQEEAVAKKPEVPEVKTAEKPEVPEFKTIEAPEQNIVINQNQLTGTHKFNYNNLQKAYAAKPQMQSSAVVRIA